MSQWRALLILGLILGTVVPQTNGQPARAPSANPPATSTTTPAARPTTAPPTMAANPPVRAPASNPPMSSPPTTGGGAGGTTTPSRAPTVAPTTAPGRAPTVAPVVAAAPGPLGAGTVNATISLLSAGSLSQTQQQQLCQAIVNGLKSNFSSISQCTVISQTAGSSPSTTGRRLQQTNSLIVGLGLGSASQSQLPAIQAALNNLIINIGNTNTQITVIAITFVTININNPPAAAVPGPTLPAGTTVALAPAGNGTMTTVTTAALPNANVTTMQNVPAAMAKPPAGAPMNGTTTMTTVMNSTHTTTIVVIAFFQITTQTTVIQQFFFTVIIGQTTGTYTTISFSLQGNVANNLPLVVTGGATTGQTRTIMVTGVTVAVVQTTTITASTATTTQTTTTTTTGTQTTSTTGSPTGTNGTNNGGGTTNVIPGVSQQICQVPNNPYGIIQNTANEGTLVKGNFLVSSWNDVNMNFGQGNLIYQCNPNNPANPATVWSNVTISGACTRDNAGVGVTMALTRCGPIIIVGSLPIKQGQATPSPGCLIALDLNGKVINEVTSPGINGPWGSICTSSGNTITLGLSSVLGGLAPSSNATTPSSGRRLQQAPSPSASVSQGFFVRWTFTVPTSGTPWALGTPAFLAQGIQTNGTNVMNGQVGPGQPTADSQGTAYLPDNLGNKIYVIPNWATTSATNGQSSSLMLTPSKQGAMAINGPNSLFFSNSNNGLLGADTQDSNLFFITLNGARNGGTSQLLQVDPSPTGGNLFNAVFSVDGSAGAPVGSILFVNDGSNTFNTVIGNGFNSTSTGSPNGSPTVAPSGARPSAGPSSG